MQRAQPLSLHCRSITDLKKKVRASADLERAQRQGNDFDRVSSWNADQQPRANSQHRPSYQQQYIGYQQQPYDAPPQSYTMDRDSARSNSETSAWSAMMSDSLRV